MIEEPKRRPGRPQLPGPKRRPCKLYLPSAAMNRLRDIGEGSASQGVLTLLALHARKSAA